MNDEQKRHVLTMPDLQRWTMTRTAERVVLRKEDAEAKQTPYIVNGFDHTIIVHDPGDADGLLRNTADATLHCCNETWSQSNGIDFNGYAFDVDGDGEWQVERADVSRMEPGKLCTIDIEARRILICDRVAQPSLRLKLVMASLIEVGLLIGRGQTGPRKS